MLDSFTFLSDLNLNLAMLALDEGSSKIALTVPLRES